MSTTELDDDIPIDTPTNFSLVPFVKRLKIVDKDLRVRTFGSVLNEPQYRILEEVDAMLNRRVPVRIIVLKARQMGVSTVILAILFAITFLRNRSRGLIISHELDSAEHLLSITQNYYDTWPFRRMFEQKNKAAKHLSFESINSRIRVSTAKNAGSGRSQTIQFLHGSEVAFWENPNELMTGLAQSIPSRPATFIFMESTANGVGNYFHDQWNLAMDNEIDFKPLFFPWYMFPEYRAEHLQLPPTLESKKTEDERILYAVLCKIMSRDEAESRLVWRRWAIKNLAKNRIETFNQEYPATPDDAFIATGLNVFKLPLLQQVYDPRDGKTGRLSHEGVESYVPGTRMMFQPHEDGEFKVFKYPHPQCRYVVFCDPTRTIRGDNTVIQVLNRDTWEQVARWRGKIDPSSVAVEIVKVALYYNNAIVNVEVTGPGSTTMGRLTGMDYTNLWYRQSPDTMTGVMKREFGWVSTPRTKPEMIGYLVGAIIDKDILIHDEDTFREMKNYVTKDNGQFGNSSNEGFDDCVTSLAGALATCIYETHNLEPVNERVSPERASLLYARDVWEAGGTDEGGWVEADLDFINREQ